MRNELENLCRGIKEGDPEAYREYFHACLRLDHKRRGSILPSCQFCIHSTEGEWHQECDHPRRHDYNEYQKFVDVSEEAAKRVPKDFEMGGYDWYHHHRVVLAMLCPEYKENLADMVPCERCGAKLDPPASQWRAPSTRNRVLCLRCGDLESREYFRPSYFRWVP